MKRFGVRVPSNKRGDGTVVDKDLDNLQGIERKKRRALIKAKQARWATFSATGRLGEALKIKAGIRVAKARAEHHHANTILAIYKLTGEDVTGDVEAIENFGKPPEPSPSTVTVSPGSREALTTE